MWKKSAGKRAATTPAPTRIKRHRPSGTSAILSLSQSIESMADAFSVGGSGTVDASPVRRKSAIRTVVEDEELSDDEIADVVAMFTDNTAIADSYLAIEKKSIRSKFLSRQLRKYNKD